MHIECILQMKQCVSVDFLLQRKPGFAGDGFACRSKACHFCSHCSAFRTTPFDRCSPATVGIASECSRTCQCCTIMFIFPACRFHHHFLLQLHPSDEQQLQSRCGAILVSRSGRHGTVPLSGARNIGVGVAEWNIAF